MSAHAPPPNTPTKYAPVDSSARQVVGTEDDTDDCPAVSLLRLNARLTLGMPTNSAASVDTDTYLSSSSALALALALALTEDCPAVGLRRSNA